MIEHFVCTQNSMCGYIENRVKFLAKKQKQAAKRDENANELLESSANELSQTITDAESQELVDKMKSLVIDKNNVDALKDDLRATRSYRSKMLLNKRSDLLESYPYFFTNIDLV